MILRWQIRAPGRSKAGLLPPLSGGIVPVFGGIGGAPYRRDSLWRRLVNHATFPARAACARLCASVACIGCGPTAGDHLGRQRRPLPRRPPSRLRQRGRRAPSPLGLLPRRPPSRRPRRPPTPLAPVDRRGRCRSTAMWLACRRSSIPTWPSSATSSASGMNEVEDRPARGNRRSLSR